MRRSDFAFDLPEDLIALHPAEPRSSARLLVQCGDATAFHTVQDLPDLLRPDDVLVLNDTKVIPARLSGRRLRGDADAAVELTLIAAQDGDGDVWRALARPARKLAPGDTLRFGEILSASVLDRDGAEATLRFSYDTSTLMEALAEAGTMPLPPYIAQRRAPDETDDASYQTVFAKRDGAIAAPTASLHFDEDLVAALDAKGITRETVTLHVGIGTFLPVKADNIADHKMHAEWGEVTEEAAERLSAAKQAGRRIIPVGTTALRLLETAARTGSIKPFRGETDIFITPGFRFQAADALMTNFHLPESTLMMLVSAFMGTERMREVYQKAIAARFRFFSYGDSSLLIPASGDAAKNDSAVSRD